jgi:alkanesulfonate monooxygenase SsuD/methylene tetrahydromethanopterin reductase-like flavin-dependent oxidoreductase (luciferase family)
VTYKGEHYAVQNATINPRPEQNPSIWIGANAPKTLKRAAQIGDCWFASLSARKSHLRKLKNVYNKERQKAGKDRSIAALREAFVIPKGEDAVSVAGPHFEAKYDRYAE